MSPARRAEAAVVLAQHQLTRTGRCRCGAGAWAMTLPDREQWIAEHQLTMLVEAGYELFRVPSSV